MQSRNSNFYFGMGFDFNQDNVFSIPPSGMSTSPPPPEGDFLLLDGTNFLLLDGTDLLLL